MYEETEIQVQPFELRKKRANDQLHASAVLAPWKNIRCPQAAVRATEGAWQLQRIEKSFTLDRNLLCGRPTNSQVTLPNEASRFFKQYSSLHIYRILLR
jgi:hypothetical protein